MKFEIILDFNVLRNLIKFGIEKVIHDLLWIITLSPCIKRRKHFISISI